MNKGKRMFGRVIAFALALVMVCSSLGTSAITAYAAGNGDAVVTVNDDTAEATLENVSGNDIVIPETSSDEDTTEEAVIEEETSEEGFSEMDSLEETSVVEDTIDALANLSLYNTEELAYTGSIEDDYWGKKLVINEGEMKEAGMTVSANAIASIINTDRGDETFSVVELNMNSVTDAVDTEVWNAVANIVDSSLNEEGHTEFRYNLSGKDAADENWCFVNPAATEESIAFGVTYSAGNAGDGINVQFDSISIPADEAKLNLYTDENRTNNYGSIIAALGEGTVGRVYDSEGTLADNLWANFEKDTFEDEGQQKAYINITLGNIIDFSVGEEYLVKAESYTGKIEGDWCGDRLTIEQWVMEEARIEVTDQAFIDIINAQEQTFGIVEFNLNSVRESISKDLWNAAVAVVEADENGNCQIRFNMSGDKVADKNWNFDRPTAIAEEGSDITLAATWSAGEAGEGITVSFANNEFPADEVYLNLYTDQNKSDYGTISEAVGTNNRAELYDGEQTVENARAEIERNSFEDNGNEIPTLNISVGNIKNLSVNTEYVVKSVAYRGHVEEDWLGNVFVIDLFALQEDIGSVSDDTIVAILEEQEAEYGAVQINFMALEDSVPANVWNAAAALLNPEVNEEGFIELRLNFCGGEEHADENWNIFKPQQVEEEDVNLVIDWTAGGAEEGMTITFANTQLPAEGARVNLCTDENRADYIALSQAIGSKPQAVMLDGEGNPISADVGADADTDDNDVAYCNVWAGNVRDFESSVPYTIKTVDYIGRVENWDGWECLWIAYYEAGKEEAFTAEEIKDILAANESVSVNEVYIEQPYDSENVSNNIIDGSVVNAALPLLKGDEDSFISFAFSDDNAKRTFKIFNPRGEATETTVWVDAGIRVIGDDESTDAFVLKNGQVSFDGLVIEREDLEIVLSRESDNGKALMGLFGESNRQLALVDDSIDIFAEYRVEENELIAYISGSERMENDREYNLSIAEYKGIVEDNVLFIYPWHVEPYGLEYTEELIVGILNDYAQAGTKFARVEIGFVDEESVYNESDISAKVYNAAIKVIDPTMDYPDDNLGIGLKYIWYKADGTIVWNYYWDNSMNPAELEKDIKMQYQIGFDEKNGNVIMTTNIPELSDTYVDLEFVPNDFEGPDLTDDLKTYFGEGDVQEKTSYILSPIPEMSYVLFQYGAYKEEDSRVQILIERIDVLENNTVYEVLPYNFGHAWVDTWEDGTECWNLYISASEIRKDTFDKGDIERSLTYRKYLKEKYDCIYIEQGNSYDDNGDLDNIIRKEDYNYIRNNFLNTDNENASIVYVFDNSDEDENGIYIQDQVRYEFMNPAVMSENMDASVNFAWGGKYVFDGKSIHGGLDIFMPKTTVPASGVNVQIHADYASKTGEYLRESLGDNRDDGTVCKIITGKETLAALNNDVWLSGYASDVDYKEDEPDRWIYNFHLSDAQKIPQNVYSSIYPVQGRGDDVLYVARKEELKTSVEGKNILWKSFTPNTATIVKDAEGSYYIEPINKGIALYGSYCLADGDKAIVEIFGGFVEKKVESMKFTNASEKNPLIIEKAPEGADWNTTDYLDLRFYPTGTDVDYADLSWFAGTVSDNSVSANCITFAVDEAGNATGEIIAVEEGEAVVTVTSKTDSTLKATAKIIVKHAVEDELIDDPIKPIFAFWGYDKTLADIEHLLPANVKWVEKKTLLTDYKDTEVTFPAIYTSPLDGRKANINVLVTIASFDALLRIRTEVPDGDEWQYMPIIDGDVLKEGKIALELLLGELDVEHINEWFGSLRPDIVFQTTATSDPKNLLTNDADDAYKYIFSVDSASKGKKTFTLSWDIVDKRTNKKTTLAKRSLSVYVPGKPLFDWDSYSENSEIFHRTVNDSKIGLDKDGYIGETGEFVIVQDAKSYYKITAKSLDTAVCKLGSVKVTDSKDKTKKITTIKYEIKNGGRAYLQLTAADEVKSAYRVAFDVFDIMPKVVTGVGTIDVTMKNIDMEAKWQILESTTLGKASVSGKGSEYFEVSVNELLDTDDNEKKDTALIGISLKDRTIKTGKYKLDITVPVTLDEITEDFTTTVTVTVKASKPVYTAKQTGKVNLYYDNEYPLAQGTLTLSDNVDDVKLVDQDSANGKKCDYELVTINDQPNLRAIRFKEGSDANSKNTKGKLILTLNGVEKEVAVNITIKTENKAPKLELTSQSGTVYPNYGQNVFGFMIIDKKTGEKVDADTLQIQNEDDTWTTFSDGTTSVIKGKSNSYSIRYYDGYFSGVATTQKKASDKLNIRVKPVGASSTISLKYNVKVDPTVPVLVPSSKTLTLNMNEELYRSQVVTTVLSLKDTTVSFAGFDNQTGWVEFEGVDAKATSAMNENLNFNWLVDADENGNPYIGIMANIHDNDSLKSGSYKYKVTVHQEGYSDISCQITVKVVDVVLSQCLSVASKGAIDLLDTDSSIRYTPKLKNLHGTLVDAPEYGYESYLVGMDSDNFETHVENGVFIVKKGKGAILSTKKTYYVTPVFVYQNEEGNTFEIRGKELKIKVKQGKPKVQFVANDGNVLYRDRNNELKIDVQAVLNKKDVAIESIELVNYKNDLKFTYDEASQTITLSQFDVNEIVATGKTWKVKFNVYYTDRSLNEKPMQVTYKLVVK